MLGPIDRLLFHLLKVLRLKYFSFKFPHIIDFRPSLLMFTEPVCEELDFSFYNFMLTRSYAKKNMSTEKSSSSLAKQNWIWKPDLLEMSFNFCLVISGTENCLALPEDRGFKNNWLDLTTNRILVHRKQRFVIFAELNVGRMGTKIWMLSHSLCLNGNKFLVFGWVLV